MGTAGFIDFVFGVYNDPEIGIEFSLMPYLERII